jgi:hypothetical protein
MFQEIVSQSTRKGISQVQGAYSVNTNIYVAGEKKDVPLRRTSFVRAGLCSDSLQSSLEPTQPLRVLWMAEA